MTRPTILIERRTSGTLSLVLRREGRADSTIRSGIPDHAEAVRRARVWKRELGYRIRDNAKETS